MLEAANKGTIVCKPEQLKWALNGFGKKQRPLINPVDVVGGLRETVEDYICNVKLADTNNQPVEHIFESADKQKQACDFDECGNISCVDHRNEHSHGATQLNWVPVHKAAKSVIDKTLFICQECGAHYAYNDRDTHFNQNHTAETCPFKCESNKTFPSREALQDHLENHCSQIPYCCLVCNDQGLSKAIKNKTFGEVGEHECYPGLVTTYNYSDPTEVRAVFQALSAEITGLKTEMKKLRIQLASQSSKKYNAAQIDRS